MFTKTNIINFSIKIMIINFNSKGDNDRGFLTAIESAKDLPFKIKRVYYINKIPIGIRRGFHAHHQLEQCLIAICGSCKILMDYGNGDKRIFELNSPSFGLIIKKMVWHEMYDFSDDCVLLALANDHYNESDYIRNYDDFLKLVKIN